MLRNLMTPISQTKNIDNILKNILKENIYKVYFRFKFASFHWNKPNEKKVINWEWYYQVYMAWSLNSVQYFRMSEAALTRAPLHRRCKLLHNHEQNWRFYFVSYHPFLNQFASWRFESAENITVTCSTEKTCLQDFLVILKQKFQND